MANLVSSLFVHEIKANEANRIRHISFIDLNITRVERYLIKFSGSGEPNLYQNLVCFTMCGGYYLELCLTVKN